MLLCCQWKLCSFTDREESLPWTHAWQIVVWQDQAPDVPSVCPAMENSNLVFIKAKTDRPAEDTGLRWTRKSRTRKWPQPHFVKQPAGTLSGTTGGSCTRGWDSRPTITTATYSPQPQRPAPIGLKDNEVHLLRLEHRRPMLSTLCGFEA